MGKGKKTAGTWFRFVSKHRDKFSTASSFEELAFYTLAVELIFLGSRFRLRWSLACEQNPKKEELPLARRKLGLMFSALGGHQFVVGRLLLTFPSKTNCIWRDGKLVVCKRFPLLPSLCVCRLLIFAKSLK